MLAPLLALVLSAQVQIQPVATVKHPPIDEMSGIARSGRYPNVYWVHNDSGDEARLFAIRADGTVLAPAWIKRLAGAETEAAPPDFGGVKVGVANNIDWEDIAIDGDTMYVADVGNNGNARTDLGVYAVIEPNPLETIQTRPVKWFPVAYEDQKGFPPQRKHFDCEAVFVFKGKLYFITKHRGLGGIVPDSSANLYRMDTRNTDKVNVLRKVDSKGDFDGWVTGAAMSPNGKTLAVLTHLPVSSVWLFSTPSGGDRFFQSSSRQSVFTGAGQCEAITWENDHSILVTNEQRQIFRLKV